MASRPPERKKSKLDRCNAIIGRALVLMVGFLAVGLGYYVFSQDSWTSEHRARIRLEAAGYAVEPASLFRAIELEDSGTFSRLQRCGISLEARDQNGRTALIAAIDANSKKSFVELLSLGVSPLAADESGRTPFACALGQSRYEIVEKLLKIGISADSPIEAGVPALVSAVHNQDQKMVELLLAKGANPGPESIMGAPLFIAVTNGNREFVELLLAAGADPDTLDPSGRPLVVAALDLDQPDLAKVLLAAKAGPNQMGRGSRSLLYRAFEDRDANLFGLAMRAGGDATQPGPDGLTMLEEAVLAQDRQWVDLLLSEGADPNLRSHKADNPLWWEMFNEGHIDFAEQLLAAGADINAVDAAGARPIDRALEIGNLKMIRYLFARGAESATRGENLWRPLEDSNHALMRFLLANGESPNSPNSNDMAPLGFAILTGDATAAALLMEYGASIDFEKKARGHTLFEWALTGGQMPIVDRLLAAGADPNGRISSPSSDEFIQRFEDRGNLKFYLERDSGLTPLMIAAGSGQYELVETLLERGASKGVHTKKWESWPINFAVKAEDIRMAQILLGRDPDTDGKFRKIEISLASQKAVIYENGEAVLSTKCSTGKKGYQTPPGVFVITDKNRLRRSNLYDADMPYFMRLNCSAIGMHQGNVPSYPASHGCIRLPYTYAKKFYAIAQVGDVVEIK